MKIGILYQNDFILLWHALAPGKKEKNGIAVGGSVTAQRNWFFVCLLCTKAQGNLLRGVDNKTVRR